MAGSLVSNRFSAVFAPEDTQNVETAKQLIFAAYMVKLASAGTGGLSGVPRVSDTNRAFTEAVAECVAEHPEFLPPFADVEEFMKDVNASKVLRPFREWARELLRQLDVSVGLADGEGYMGVALPYYANAQRAAKLGVPAAVTVVARLAPRFKAQGRRPRAAARRASRGAGDPPTSKD